MRKLIAGNWKMNGMLAALDEVAAIAETAAAHPAADVALALPATLIAAAAARWPGLAIGAQDVHARDSGAHTGCLSAAMLREAGARFTLVGHSERRGDQGETNQDVWAKAVAARRCGLSVILCVGETAEERDAGRAARVVQAQIEQGLPDDAEGDWLTLAYEPRWAIGTGRTPSIPEIAEIHAVARAKARALLGDRGGAVRILYGGSVTGANVGEILAIADVDGALVGGASLTAAKFAPIVAAGAATAV